MSTDASVVTPVFAKADKPASTASSKKYKSVPENWKAVPEARFRQVISHLESVLFEISPDGSSVHLPQGSNAGPALQRWAAHLRDALKALTTGS
ncbi:MAG TPA: hypothetical protein VNN77_08600 [candidate division Zixibacteria bacterium]|nr:hypothetical protein [candidate division Zixibacteria bacterium]